MSERVFISGMGVISAVGNNVNDFWQSLLSQKNGISDYEPLEEAGLANRKAGYVTDFNPKELIKGINTRRLSRYSRFTLAAIEQAISDSNIDLEKIDSGRKGLIFNTIRGSFETTIQVLNKLFQQGPQMVSPLKFAQTVTNAPATPVSIKYQLKGISTVIMGASAICLAYDYLKNNDADIIICGGVDVITTIDSFKALAGNNMLATAKNGTPELSCPGDMRHNGVIYGEGAGFVVLENQKSVEKRNGNIYCEIVGYGNAHDNMAVKYFNQRDAKPIEYSMTEALRDANINADQLSYINSMANSAPQVDECEAEAIKNVVKNYANIPVSTYKGSTGETFGSSDTLGVIQTALTLKNQKVAPIANLENIAPQCGLNYISKKPKEYQIQYGLANSFEVGGNVQSIVLKVHKG